MTTTAKKTGWARAGQLAGATGTRVLYSFGRLLRTPLHRDARGVLASLIGVYMLYAENQMVVGAALMVMLMFAAYKLLILVRIRGSRRVQLRVGFELATSWPRLDWVDHLMAQWSYTVGVIAVLWLDRTGGMTVVALLLANQFLEWANMATLNKMQTHILTCKCKTCRMLQHIREVNLVDE